MDSIGSEIQHIFNTQTSKASISDKPVSSIQINTQEALLKNEALQEKIYRKTKENLKHYQYENNVESQTMIADLLLSTNSHTRHIIKSSWEPLYRFLGSKLIYVFYAKLSGILITEAL